MQSQAPAGPSRETGLPPGVEVGPLGARFVAYLIDSVVPAICGVVLGFLAPGTTGGSRVVLSTVVSLIALAWAVLVLVLIARRAASPGMQLMKLQVVGFYDGRPIGLLRAFLRGLVFWALGITGIGLLIMLVLMLLHPRHQGWHDRIAEAVMIRARSLAPPAPPSTGPPAAVSSGPQYAPQQYSPQQPAAQRPAYPPQYSGPPQPQYPSSGPASYEPQPAPAYAPQIPSDEDGATAADLTTDATAVHVAAQRSGWRAVLDDGRAIEVDGLVLLGRNPQPQPGEEDAQLIKIADETRTVSKSHLAIGLDAAGIYVVDRGSTNGSTVTDPGGSSNRCRVSEPVYVGEDTIVSIGDHWLRIERAAD
jgi:uncharacterized RDD family membrane protein YckC